MSHRRRGYGLITALAAAVMCQSMLVYSQSCAGNCGTKPFDTCSCEINCSKDSCCEDFETECVTCKGSCNKLTPYNICNCSEFCAGFGDCCHDYDQHCSQLPELLGNGADSCKGRCGAHAPSYCFCEDFCTLMDDCCDDYSMVCLSSSQALPPSQIVPGDANLDGQTDVIDFVTITTHLLELHKLLSGSALTNADQDGDQKLTVVDIIILLPEVTGGGGD